MYWLRRIPVETRIVVLVVFLALLQAILLSAFGLVAIKSERQRSKAKLEDDAREFLVHNVSRRSLLAVRNAADEAFAAAFDEQRADWRTGLSETHRDLFTDAFVVLPDATIRAPTGELLWVARARYRPLQREIDEAASRVRTDFRKSAISLVQKVEHDLDLAQSFPFARDADGGSLGLLLAGSALPTFVPEVPVHLDRLAVARRVAVLIRIAGDAPAMEVERFLAMVDAAVPAVARTAFAAIAARQDREAAVLATLVREAPSMPTRGESQLRRNVVAVGEGSFYLRYRRGTKQILAVDDEALGAFLRSQIVIARRESDGAVEPRLLARSVRRSEPRPTVPLEGIPGWSVTAEPADIGAIQPSGGERVYWYIIGFSVIGILAGGVLTARVVSREVRLAKLKSGFVSNVSHGLKTPLTSIRMFSDMLRNGHVESEEEQRECLDVIAQETNRLERLIQQVLDFGRLEARRRPFQWRTASLAPLVEREVERFRRATGMKHDAVDVQVAVNLPPATFDPDAFTEVVANLMSNAFKYSPPHDRRIAVTLGPERGRVVLAVEDNGRGVPRPERRKIFEQFYRVDDLLAQEVEGTGLGLAIVRSIVRAHGGRIAVEDSALGGSRFVVTIPAATRAQRTAQKSAESSA